MQAVTLTIALAVSALILYVRPVYGLAACFAVLVWYPDYLRVSIGTIDISAARIVITVLLLRCVCDSRLLSRFKWSPMDRCVAASMVVYVGVYCITHPFEAAIENRGGFLIDTWITYLTTRLVISDREELFTFITVLGTVLALMALLGIFEAVTHQQPYTMFKRYRPWRTVAEENLGRVRIRFGLARAVGPFPHSIMFGNCFAMFMPAIWALRNHVRWKKAGWYVLFGLLTIGVLSSMSSGPWAMMMIVLFCLLLERWKHLVRGILWTVVVGCLGVELFSNRHFYHVFFNTLNFAGGEWWQRAKLVDVAIAHVNEWWLAGYRGVDPGWGSRYFYAAFTDINNEFILAGVEYGLWGVIMLCAVLAAAFAALIKAARRTSDVELRSLHWALGSTLVGVIVAWQGVSFFGQMVPLYYLVLGLVGASVSFVRAPVLNGSKSVSARARRCLPPRYERV